MHKTVLRCTLKTINPNILISQIFHLINTYHNQLDMTDSLEKYRIRHLQVYFEILKNDRNNFLKAENRIIKK